MKNALLLLISLFLTTILQAQIIEVKIVIDYSNATIFGMDEASFAEYETDWYKDKPDIDYKLVNEVLNKTDKCLKISKTAKNTILIKVKKVSDKGGYVCDVKLMNSNNTKVIELDNVSSIGGVWGSKLNLMGDGAEELGKNIGIELQKSIKKYKKYVIPLCE